MTPFDWRSHLKVHPAADEFELMSPEELRTLADDIKEHGLRSPIILCQEGWRDKDGAIWLLDGRNRLDALALLGWLEPPRERSKREPAKKYRRFVRDNPLAISDECPCSDVPRFQTYSNCDPYALALSLNIHRRHLKPEEKRDLIAKLLKAKPETSDRSIGEIVDADHKTVAKVRARLEDVGTIPHVEKRTDSKNRKQPAKKTKPVTDSPPSDDHRKPGDYWSGQDCGGNWYVSVVTDEMGPATWTSKDAAGPFETEAEAQAWIVEEDRKTCIALNQKALDAERALAEFKTATSTTVPTPEPANTEPVVPDTEPMESKAQPVDERWKVEASGDGWQVKYRLKGKGKWRALRWYEDKDEAEYVLEDIRDVLSEALLIEQTGTDWRGDYADQCRENDALKKRLDLTINALDAKEKEAGRSWPETMTTKQTKKRDQILQNIMYWQRDLEALHGEVTGKRSWRVEVTTKDGTRHENGLRFSTKDQAELYANGDRQREYFGDEFASIEVIACRDDKSNVAIHGTSIGFNHGDCVLFNWHPLNSAEPESVAGNDIDTAAAATAAHAALNGDGLDIPPFMRRTGNEEAAS
jgi:hypothetical protein